MIRWLIILLAIGLPSGRVAYGQYITPQSSQKEIKTFLKNKGGDKVDFCEAHKDVYFVQSKKTGKWGMFDWYGMLIPMEYDTIQSFDQFQPFTIGKRDGKNVVIQWPYDTESEGIRVLDGVDNVHIRKYKSRGISSASYFLIASKNEKWGCLDWTTLSVLIPFQYDSPDHVPIESISLRH